MHQGSCPGPRLAPPGVVTANIIKIRINRNRNLTSKTLEAAYGGYSVPVGREAGSCLLMWLRLGGLTPSMMSSQMARLCFPFSSICICVFTAPPPRLLAHIWSSKFRLGASKYQSLMDDCFATIVSKRLKSISIMDKMCSAFYLEDTFCFQLLSRNLCNETILLPSIGHPVMGIS